MSDFLSFLALIGTELYDLFAHYKAGKDDVERSQQLAMRIARKVSDEIALRETQGP